MNLNQDNNRAPETSQLAIQILIENGLIFVPIINIYRAVGFIYGEVKVVIKLIEVIKATTSGKNQDEIKVLVQEILAQRQQHSSFIVGK